MEEVEQNNENSHNSLENPIETAENNEESPSKLNEERPENLEIPENPENLEHSPLNPNENLEIAQNPEEIAQKLEELPPPPPNPFEESPLHPEVKLLLEQIFSEDLFQRQLQSEDVETSRFSVQSFPPESFAKAYGILTEILDGIHRKKPSKLLENLSQSFYSLIPHRFPQKKPLLLDSEAKVFAKLELLSLITDIQIASNLNEEQKQLKILKEKERRVKEKRELEELEKQKKKAGQKSTKKDKEKEVLLENNEAEAKDEQPNEEEVILIEDVKNFYDRNYENLHCEIQPLSNKMQQFDLISCYLHETLQGISPFYTCEVLNIYKLKREAEHCVEKPEETPIVEEKKENKAEKKRAVKEKAEQTEAKPQDKENPSIFEYNLLMYGCKTANLVANLSKGLRLPHTLSPTKAYKLGKGVYLSDTASKSTNFCYASKENNVGFLVLCYVDLGIPLEKTEKAWDLQANSLGKSRKSVKGLGRIRPKEEKIVDLNELENEKFEEKSPVLEENLQFEQNFNENQENSPRNLQENQETQGNGKAGQENRNFLAEEEGKNANIRLLKVPSGELEPSLFQDSTFLYNEYVIFEEKQIKMAYLVKLKFDFK